LALMAGFQRCASGIAITMDADLQDRPEDIPKFLRRIEEGYDLVCGARQRRHDQATRKLGSRLYNWVVRRLSGLHLRDFNCGFKAYRAELLHNIVIFGQYHRYIPLISHLAGFRVSEVEIGNDPRKYGTSKFNTFRYQGFFDLLSILFTHKYGLNPLHFFGTIGMFLTVPSVLVVLYLIFSQVLYLSGFGQAYMVQSRPLLLLSLNVFLVGVVVFLVGFICDFILHHQISRRIQGLIRLSTRMTIGEDYAATRMICADDVSPAKENDA